MARANVNKPYVNFTNGLITEATGLSYPENSARDLDNVDLHKSGKVSRRLGCNIELNGVDMVDDATGTIDPQADDFVSVHDWPSPGGDDTKHWVVYQVGKELIVRDILADVVSASGFTSGNENFEIDDAPFNGNEIPAEWDSPTLAELREDNPLQSAVGRGNIYFAGPHCTPFTLVYDPDTDVISALNLRGDASVFGGEILTKGGVIRDFRGVDDSLGVAENPGTLSAEHLYNLENQGWRSSRIDAYYDAHTNYPSNSQQWFVGKDSTDNFSATELVKHDFGTSEAPKGSMKINALTGNKDNLFTLTNDISGSTWGPSGTDQVDFSDAEDERAVHGGAFKTIAFHAGRLWVSGDRNPERPNGVYFSQVVQNSIPDAMNFYQQNDPTTEHFNSLLDNDGGVIYISEATSINKLVSFLDGLLVFADNGLWYIRGGDVGFSPREYSVDKISSNKFKSPQSVVEAENVVLAWAESGIYAIDGNKGYPQLNKISSGIESFYNELNEARRRDASGVYDSLTEKVVWFYKGADKTYTEKAFRTDLLIFDLQLQAFYKYSTDIHTNVGRTLGICAAASSPVKLKAVDSVTVGFSPPVRVDDRQLDLNLKVLSIELASDSLNIQEFNNLNFLDFIHQDGTSTGYVSYLETGDETLGDIARTKQSPYVYSYFEATENEAYDDGSGNLFLFVPSSCNVTFKWDWHNTDTGNRWSNPQQAYRRRRPLIAAVPGPVDNGEGVVYSKRKARGKGKALSIRYESEAEKDFQLLGFNVEITAGSK